MAGWQLRCFVHALLMPCGALQCCLCCVADCAYIRCPFAAKFKLFPDKRQQTTTTYLVLINLLSFQLSQHFITTFVVVSSLSLSLHSTQRCRMSLFCPHLLRLRMI